MKTTKRQHKQMQMRDQETEPRVRVNDSDYVLKGSEKHLNQKQQQRRDMMIQVYMGNIKRTNTIGYR